MPVRDVALDRDVRSLRLLPARASLRSVHFLRRSAAVLTLVGIDAAALLLALLAAALVAGMSQLRPLARPLVVGSRDVLHRPLPSPPSSAVSTDAATHDTTRARSSRRGWSPSSSHPRSCCVVDPDGLGARLVAVWLLACALSLAGRWVFDALLALKYGAEGECPGVLLLGESRRVRRGPPHPGRAAAGGPRSSSASWCPAGRPQTCRSARRGAASLPADGAPPSASRGRRAGRAARGAAEHRRRPGDHRRPRGAQRPAPRRHGRVPGRAAPRSRSSPRTCTWTADAGGYIPGLDCPLFVVQPTARRARPATSSSRLRDRVVAAAAAGRPQPAAARHRRCSIKLTSRGPVFFVDERVGVGQRPFRLYKFRTMVAGAHEAQAELEAAATRPTASSSRSSDDPRVTGSAACCGASASTSCRSSSTCSRAT